MWQIDFIEKCLSDGLFLTEEIPHVKEFLANLHAAKDVGEQTIPLPDFLHEVMRAIDDDILAVKPPESSLVAVEKCPDSCPYCIRASRDSCRYCGKATIGGLCPACRETLRKGHV